MGPRLSVRAVFYSQDHILLCKHYDERGFWYITPGGGVEYGETLEDAFHRELMEEVGLQAHMEMSYASGISFRTVIRRLTFPNISIN